MPRSALGHLKDSPEPSYQNGPVCSSSRWFCGPNGAVGGHPADVESRPWGQEPTSQLQGGSRHRTCGCSGGAGSGWLSRLRGTMTPSSHSCPRLLFRVPLTPISDYHWVRLQPQIPVRAWGKGFSRSAQPRPDHQLRNEHTARSGQRGFSWRARPRPDSCSRAFGAGPEPTVHFFKPPMEPLLWEWDQQQGTRAGRWGEKLGPWWGDLSPESRPPETQSFPCTYPSPWEAIIPYFQSSFELEFLLLATKNTPVKQKPKSQVSPK